MPLTQKTPAPLAGELNLLVGRVARIKSAQEMLLMLSRLNELQSRVVREPTLEYATYLLVRGLLYSKASRLQGGGWPYSQSETLNYAIDTLCDADDILRKLLKSRELTNGWRLAVGNYRHTAVYEAMVAYTTLRTWGQEPSSTPDTGVLSLRTQRHISRALKHGWALSSRL